MAYTKPQVIAQNASSGSYAAGCPENLSGGSSSSTTRSGGKLINCKACERTQ